MNIEKNIPIPPPRKENAEIKPTLQAMSIGDSVLVPIISSMTFRNAAARLDIKVTSRKESPGWTRFWRTA
jgi:hypothetical protein